MWSRLVGPARVPAPVWSRQDGPRLVPPGCPRQCGPARTVPGWSRQGGPRLVPPGRSPAGPARVVPGWSRQGGPRLVPPGWSPAGPARTVPGWSRQDGPRLVPRVDCSSRQGARASVVRLRRPRRVVPPGRRPRRVVPRVDCSSRRADPGGISPDRWVLPPGRSGRNLAGPMGAPAGPIWVESRRFPPPPGVCRGMIQWRRCRLCSPGRRGPPKAKIASTEACCEGQLSPTRTGTACAAFPPEPFGNDDVCPCKPGPQPARPEAAQGLYAACPKEAA
jgi:hypothetical protein